MRRLVAFLGLLAGFACALAFACKSSPVDVDAGEVVEAGMRGGPVVGSNPGQPFGNCPDGSDCAGSTWQQMRANFLQQIALKLDAAAGTNAIIQLNDAGQLVLGQQVFPPVDGGFPSGTTSQVLVETSGGPGFASMIGDLRCVSSGSNYTCTLVGIQGVPLDGGGVDGSVLTLINGQWSPQPPVNGVPNLNTDLATVDGGQTVVVGVTGNDGGAAIPVHVQGFAVDGLQPTFGIQVAAASDAAASPAGVTILPSAPNAGAATTASGTPGPVTIMIPVSLSTGKPGGLHVAMSDGSVQSYLIAEISNLNANDGTGYLCLGYQDGGCTTSSYTLATYPSNGTVSLSAIGEYINFTVDKGLYTPLLAIQPLGVGFAPLGGIELGLPQTVIQPTVTNPEIQFAPRNGDTPTTPLSILGQSGYAGGGANNIDAGPVEICSGNPGGTGLTGAGPKSFVSQGAGYVPGTPNVCNQTTIVDRNGMQLLQPGTSGWGLATSCTLYADPGGTGECFGKDSTGTGYRLNPLGGACAAMTPALCADLAEVSGAGQWTGSSGHVTTFAPAGGGSIDSQNQHTLSNVFYARTTTNGQTVAINFTDPTHVSGIGTFYIHGRVIAAGSASIDDSIEYATDEMFNNASGTPADLGTTVGRRTALAYTPSLSGLVSTIGTNYAPNQVGIQITHTGIGLGAIDWTLSYVAELN